LGLLPARSVFSQHGDCLRDKETRGAIAFFRRSAGCAIWTMLHREFSLAPLPRICCSRNVNVTIFTQLGLLLAAGGLRLLQKRGNSSMHRSVTAWVRPWLSSPSLRSEMISPSLRPSRVANGKSDRPAASSSCRCVHFPTLLDLSQHVEHAGSSLGQCRRRPIVGRPPRPNAGALYRLGSSNRRRNVNDECRGPSFSTGGMKDPLPSPSQVTCVHMPRCKFWSAARPPPPPPTCHPPSARNPFNSNLIDKQH